jgi:hypothetical protein
MAILTGAGPDMQGIFRDGEALNVPGWGYLKTRSFQIRQDMMEISGAALSGTECSPLAAAQGVQAQTDAQTFVPGSYSTCKTTKTWSILSRPTRTTSDYPAGAHESRI